MGRDSRSGLFYENDYHSLVEDGRLTLADLPLGAAGVVADVCCPRPVARRLMEMGVLPGTRVRVVRIAPLGDPIVLHLRGYLLSIRRREAADVILTDVRTPAPVSSGEREADPAVSAAPADGVAECAPVAPRERIVS